MKHVIYLSTEDRIVLSKKFNTTLSTVCEALRFKRNNRRASEMRSYAVNHLNGILITV